MEISQLVAKREQLQYELNTENQRGAVKDGAKVTQLENDIKAIDITIEEQGKAEELQVVTAEAAKFMESLDFGGNDIKDLFINYSEEKAIVSYEYVNAVIQNAVAKMKQAELANQKTLESTISALQEKYNQSEAANEQLNIELSNKTLEIVDLNSRITNATRLLDEEKVEVERLKSQVDDLRNEIALGAVAAIKVEEVDVRSAHEKWLEQRKKEEDAKPIIYDISWKDDIRRDTYVAKLAATDEKIEFPYYAMNGNIEEPTTMKGKYRVVSKEDTEPFRTAYLEEQERNHEDMAQHSSVEDELVTVPAFREDSDSTTSGLDQTYASSEVAGSEVSREEFEALKSTVKRLESAVFTVREVA